MASQCNKILLSVAVLLAAALAVRFCPASDDAGRKILKLVAFPRMSSTKTTVKVVLWNNLEGQESLEVDCSENDGEVDKVAYGESARIEVMPDYRARCRFGFDGKVYLYENKFDVYQNGRDEGCGSRLDRSCNWVIKENGPCFHDDDLKEDLCFSWDKVVM